MDKKLTDSEIVKAFKICNDLDEVGFCKDCPHDGVERCIQYTNQKTLDLINRLQSKNEEYQKSLEKILAEVQEAKELYVKDIANAKAEAYKQCIEEVKKELSLIRLGFQKLLDNEGVFAIDMAMKKVDNLLKELKGND